MSTSAPDDPRTLVDELLAEQRQLTAVDRFSQRHETGNLLGALARYRELIPATAPAPGQQYAFEVDLDKCSGCKACVSACHSLNGLDEGEMWRDVGLLKSEDWRHPYQQTITTACHHCVDPGCLNGCPVLAYDKDPQTGIVRHLDDQCIGCQYCVMKCPYDVPKYSAKRGIVRKCDMCASRLAVGEAPACAQACPSEAIRITIVQHSEIIGSTERGEFLPGAPDPRITLPTTRYKSARAIPTDSVGADHGQLKPATAHTPLVFMLVLTQLSVGAAVGAIFSEVSGLAEVALGAGVLGMAIATLHLGRPLQAWRAFLGWRKSWFSREVICFGGYLPLMAASVAAGAWGKSGTWILGLKIAGALAGVAGVACSAMIYADTQRKFWRASQSLGKFFGTAAVLGLAAVLALTTANHATGWATVVTLAALLVGATMVKMGVEQRVFRELADENTPTLTPINRTARLLAGRLGFLMRTRVLCAVLGGVGCPLLLVLNNAADGRLATIPAVAALLFCLAGELLERHLFFVAVSPERMPGGVAS